VKTSGGPSTEIDASYYTFLSPGTVTRWAQISPPDFLFSAKCHRLITRNEPGMKEPAPHERQDMVKRFVDSFGPLLESGKLLCFLAQFGPLFGDSVENRAYLQELRGLMGTHPLAVEFRHRSWLDEKVRETTFSFLDQHNLLYTAVDLPHLRTLPPFVPHALGDCAYFRLHGRNKEWFTAGREERYNYLYSDEELRELVPSFISFEGKKKLTVVYFNNCHVGAAMKNALKLKKLLGGKSSRKVSYVQGEFDFSI